MATNKIPGALERRHLLERTLAPAQALEIADAYLEAGRAVEAVDFLAKAEANERLEALGETAADEGDAFLLQLTARALRREPAAATWDRLAAAAERLGKGHYAELARRQAAVAEA